MEESAQTHGQPNGTSNQTGDQLSDHVTNERNLQVVRNVLTPPPITMQIWWDEDVGD